MEKRVPLTSHRNGGWRPRGSPPPAYLIEGSGKFAGRKARGGPRRDGPARGDGPDRGRRFKQKPESKPVRKTSPRRRRDDVVDDDDDDY